MGTPAERALLYFVQASLPPDAGADLRLRLVPLDNGLSQRGAPEVAQDRVLALHRGQGPTTILVGG
jgi:hypothetical protein